MTPIIRSLIRLALGLALLGTLGCQKSIPGTAKNYVNGSGYLGSDKILGLIAQATSVSLAQADRLKDEAPTADRLCPLPKSNDELFPFIDGMNADQKKVMRDDLSSAAFRAALTVALRRLEFSSELPELPWGPSEEMRVPRNIPETGRVKVHVNFEKLDGYSVRALVRVVIHEALHLLSSGVLDGSEYRGFLQFRQYANYLGGCVGRRFNAPYRIAGLYQGTFNGEPHPLLIEIQDENGFQGRFGAVPNDSSGVNGALQIRGVLNGDSLTFEMAQGSSVRYAFSGTVAQVAGRYNFQGNFSATGLPNVPSSTVFSWQATEVPNYASEFSFSPAALSNWSQLLPGLPTTLLNAIQGKPGTASFLLAPAPQAQPTEVSISLTYLVSGSPSFGAGVVVGDASGDNHKFISVLVDLSNGVPSLRFHRGYDAQPLKVVGLGAATSGLGGRLTVQRCGSDLVAFLNGVEKGRLALSAINLDLDLPSHNGLMLYGTGAYITSYVVTEPIYCR